MRSSLSPRRISRGGRGRSRTGKHLEKARVEPQAAVTSRMEILRQPIGADVQALHAMDRLARPREIVIVAWNVHELDRPAEELERAEDLQRLAERGADVSVAVQQHERRADRGDVRLGRLTPVAIEVIPRVAR